MISTTHIVTGAAIGLYVERMFLVGGFMGWGSVGVVVLILVLGIISHHLLDLVIHTDSGSFREAGDDSAMTRNEVRFAFMDNVFGTLLILGIFFFVEPSWLMLVGSIGANFPDLWHHPVKWRHFTRKRIVPAYYRFHEWFHWTARGKLIPFGIFTNLFFIIVGLLYILY